ncbi:MAG: Gfo/Idh/MocA family oxidoreductase [Nanoarchaeota archaeon]
MSDKKIKLGVLGCSNFLRKRIFDAISKCEYGNIVCLASRDIEKAKKWAEEFNIESYDSYERLLKRKDIDAVYIALPIGLHKEWSIKAAEYEKHIICEKSLAESFYSVIKIIESCKKNNVKLYENIMIKNHPQHYKVLEMIKNDKIGKMFSIKSSFGHAPLEKNDIRYKKELNNGILNDVVCYPIFISRLFFNEEPLNVDCNLFIDNKTGVDIKGCIKLEFSGNKIAFFDFGFDNFYQNNYEIWGSEGLIRVNRAYSIGEDNPEIEYEYENKKEKIECEIVNQYAKTFDDFFLNILDDKESKFDEMIKIAKIMEACRISNKENRKINLDEINENKKVVVVSGYFDPLHIGHLELFELSKKLGDKLIVILNNDKQVLMKRGKAPFMNQEQRKKLLESIKYIDEVFISIDGDRSVCESLKFLKPDIFANGGDRHQGEIPESKLCRELGIKMVDGQGEKIASSRDYYINN